jgi:C-terminal processing protease CtpA/Prc
MSYSKITKMFFLTILSSFIISCGGGGGDSSSDGLPSVNSTPGLLSYSPASCSDEDQNKFIDDVMHDVYLWSTTSPEVDHTAYALQSDLLDALKSPLDKWSYVITEQQYQDYYSGASVGLGFNLLYNSSTKEIFVSMVYPGSPVDNAGIKRGFKLDIINGHTAADIIDNNLWSEALGEDVKGVTVDITYTDSADQQQTTSVVKDDFYSNSVIYHNIYTNTSSGKKIGYINYKYFSSEYASDLSATMTDFENNGVNELVVDLRYNGGGQNSATIYLGNIIGGLSMYGQIMYKYLHNLRYTPWNRNIVYSMPAYLMNIEKVVFLVGSGTASASELLINLLKPSKDIFVIGTATHGKPVGMYSFPFCDKRLTPITFQTVNSSDEGDYFNGIAPDCVKYENLSKDFGAADEVLLSAAINYLQTNSCTDAVSAKDRGKLRMPELNKIDRTNKLF